MTDAPTGRVGRGQVQHMPLKEFVDFGYLAEVNRQILHPLGLALAIDVDDHTCSIWDAREDPEGWVFSAVEFAGLSVKAARVEAEWERRAPSRVALLGSVIQVLDPNVGNLHPSLASAPALQEEPEEVSRFASDAPPPFTPQGYVESEGVVTGQEADIDVDEGPRDVYEWAKEKWPDARFVGGSGAGLPDVLEEEDL